MSAKFLFVTGTDTGIGKTLVSRALLAAWRRRGLPVAACKPLETGIPETGTTDTISDAAKLAEATGQSVPQTAWLRLLPPLAPQAAAQRTGSSIDPQALVAACRRFTAPHVLIEGAGGLLVPIASGYTMADLAQALDAAVLVVARTRLGTINHSLLTIAECRRRGLYVCGVVLNRCTRESGPEDADNAALIKEHGATSVFGPLPHLMDDRLDTLADAAERHLPVQEIYSACYLHRP